MNCTRISLACVGVCSCFTSGLVQSKISLLLPVSSPDRVVVDDASPSTLGALGLVYVHNLVKGLFQNSFSCLIFLSLEKQTVADFAEAPTFRALKKWTHELWS